MIHRIYVINFYPNGLTLILLSRHLKRFFFSTVLPCHHSIKSQLPRISPLLCRMQIKYIASWLVFTLILLGLRSIRHNASACLSDLIFHVYFTDSAVRWKCGLQALGLCVFYLQCFFLSHFCVCILC